MLNFKPFGLGGVGGPNIRIVKRSDEVTTTNSLPTSSLEVDVLNIPSESTNESLKRFFLQFGRVSDVKIKGSN